MPNKLEVELGILFNSVIVGFNYIIHDLFPLISFISALTWAIIGCHGVWLLLKDKFKKN